MLRHAFLVPAMTVAVAVTLLAAAPLDVEVKDVRAPASTVTAALELRDVVPDRFKTLIENGQVLHLRLQAELWESRPVWDRLVYPGIVRVFRLGRTPSAATTSITDTSNATSTALPNPMTLVLDLGQVDRVAASQRYYVHVIATLGTLAEREAEDVGDAVFGRASEANALGSLGRTLFRAAVRISDYLQSVSAEARSRRMAGSDILKR